MTTIFEKIKNKPLHKVWYSKNVTKSMDDNKNKIVNFPKKTVQVFGKNVHILKAKTAPNKKYKMNVFVKDGRYDNINMRQFNSHKEAVEFAKKYMKTGRVPKVKK